MKSSSAKTFLVTASVMLGLLAGCGHDSAEPRDQPDALPTANVSTTKVIQGEQPSHEQVVGSVKARLSSRISAKVSGRIFQLVEAIGTRVRKGDLLAELEAEEFKAQVAGAKAQLDNATRELERFRRLLDNESVTRSEFDAVNARHEVAEATLREAETMLGYTRVMAPFDGVITARLADLGDLTSPGSPLLDLESLGTPRFEAGIPEALTSSVRVGDAMQLLIEGQTDPVQGSVAEMSPTVDARSRTLLVKLDLPQEGSWKPGMFGRLLVPTRDSRNVQVPRSAVLQRGQLELVFVVDEGQARLRLVRTGRQLGDQLEILAGLEAGEEIVVEGHHNLRDGQPLQIRKP